MGVNDFKLEETLGSDVAFPLCKSSIHSVCPGLFKDKNNFFQIKTYYGLFSDCHVQRMERL